MKEVLRRIEGRVTKLLRPLRKASEDDARPLDALGYAQAESITGARWRGRRGGLLREVLVLEQSLR